MDPAVKRKWVEALRSGKYPQSRDFLQNRQGYCCLGVLCELAVKAGVAQKVDLKTAGLTSYDRETKVLPQSVCTWAGLDPNENSPDVWFAGEFTSLAYLNDTGTPFPRIAEVIEKSL